MLRWALQTGEAYRAARKIEDEGGEPVLDALQPPDVIDGYGGWYEAFWELATERQIGMGEGEIPASAIARYVDGWAYDDVLIFEHCMRQMDRVWLARHEKPKPDGPPVSARDAFRGATADRRKG